MAEFGETEVARMTYHAPIMVGVRYEEITKEPLDPPQEAQAWFQVNGERKTAFVPLYAVDEEQHRAFGAIIAGSQDNVVMVEFPPTTFGQSRFTAQKEDLEKIVIYQPGARA